MISSTRPPTRTPATHAGAAAPLVDSSDRSQAERSMGDRPGGERTADRTAPGYRSAQRTAILVDVQNMFYAARELHGGKLNYKRLFDFVLRGRPLVRAIAYCVVSPDRDASPFLHYLEALGYETRTKVLKRRVETSLKTSWEVGIAVDAMMLAPRVDAIALVTGDGDFTALADALAAQGVFVEGYGFREFTSNELVQSLHRFTSFDSRIIGPYIERDRDPEDDASRTSAGSESDPDEAYDDASDGG